MPSKRLDIKIRILLFIICSVGILYISMLLFYRPVEGFQTANNCYYDTTTFPGKKVWGCPTETDAVALLNDPGITLSDTDQVCFLTPNPTDYTKKYYTCYQRPPDKLLNISDGIRYDTDLTKDVKPIVIENDMTQLCSDYTSENARFLTVLKSTIAYQKMISSVSGRISFTTNELIGLSTQYCKSGVTRQQNFVDFCTTLQDGIRIYENLPKGNYGLNYISTTITGEIYANILNLYSNVYQPGYKGFLCSGKYG